MSQNKRVIKKTARGPAKKHVKTPVKKQTDSGLMRGLQTLQKYMFIGVLILTVYVVFFMPVGTGKAPVDQGGTQSNTTQQTEVFNLYRYLNEVKSAKGNLTFNCDFTLDNGDKLKIESSQKFETKGATTSVKGSTIYNLNENAAVLDDFTYLSEGQRYSKGPTGYVKTAYKPLDAGNINLGKIEEQLVKDEKLMKEDGVSCYKYSTTMSYGDMSNEIRAFIRSQNVNVADIDNLMLDISIFVTENGIPYKIKVEFENAKCMIKSSGLTAKNGTASGTLTIALSGFNGVESIDIPSDALSAPEGAYTFTDKLDRYLSRIGN